MDTTIVETNRCFVCGNRAALEVPLEGLRAWQNGELIQVALPDLSAAQRELLISGVHEHCWEKISREDEEDDDE
jgi:hypothetical protein